MAKTVSNQITFLDVTDQQKLSIYLTSNLPTVQIRSKDTYNPSWEDGAGLNIELQAFLENKNISDESLTITWYEKYGTDGQIKIEGATSKTLKINKNKLGANSKMLTYICEVQYGSYEPVTSQLTYTLIDEHEGVAGESAVTFHVYAPNGTVFSNQSGILYAKAVAYLGSSEITSNITYTWEVYENGEYKTITDATDDIYTIYGENIANIKTYRCTIEYNGQSYTDVITFEDKSDTYVSEMLTIGGNIFKNGQGGSAVYVIVRSNGKEVDSFPDGCYVGTDEPSSPASDMYWWKVTDGAATFMKYDGSEWNETLDDVQKLDYVWTLMDKNGNVSKNFNKSGKVIYLSCSDIKNIGTLQCDVKVKDGYVTYNDGMVSINKSSGLSASDDDNGNVTVSSSIEYTITDDNNGNVIIT